ncbi:MAG: crossover junction endodeoxyribonuclease RuvC [Anaerolineales bacterium]|nr:crossover junction endodeoxyribonuclease RuvC [Anaerolineales bacterium]
MLVIGIDPGTATTGYGLVEENEDGSLTAVDYGVITTPCRPAHADAPARVVPST